jgi:hypothetical protein
LRKEILYSMNKAYDRTIWENFPSTASPLNAINLNKLSVAVDTIDDRVIELSNTLTSVSTQVNGLMNLGLTVEDGKIKQTITT